MKASAGATLALVLLAALALAAPLARGQAGVYPEAVVFGQSAAFSGEAAQLGLEVRLGLEAAFREAAAKGGVHGRIPRLIALDDGYDPANAVINTRRLIEEEEVFALVGSVGTPTARSALPVTQEAQVPYIAPVTGAIFLRDPSLGNVVNLRASYHQETEEIVKYLVESLDAERIAILYQDDTFGLTGLEGLNRALDSRGLAAAVATEYPRNTRSVKTGVLEIRHAYAQAVVMIGSYRPVAEAVAWSRRLRMDPHFMTVSFVGSNALAEALGPAGEGLVVSQVVPDPLADTYPLQRQYRAALAAYAPEASPGFVSLEGYLAGRLALEGLQRAGRDLHRKGFLAALKAMQQVEIGGFPLSFGSADNQGSDAVFLTAMDATGRYHPVGSPATDSPAETPTP